MKYFIYLILLVCFVDFAFAEPYLASKHEFKMKDSDYSKTINHLRLGNTWKMPSGLSFYGELGVVESFNNGESLGDGDIGKSYEFGFAKKLSDRFAIKGKWEGTEIYNSTNSHKIEIKTKYKF